MEVDTTVLGLSKEEVEKKPYIASMGVYVFKKEILLNLLSVIEHSVVGIRSRINSNVHLKDTVMLGADFYETESEVASLFAEGGVPIGIGENTKIKECIIDKNGRIGKNVIIANSEGVQEADRSTEGFYIRSGVTVVLKNSVIKDGTVI
ncbi:hypothetical protein G4B88_000163 [Cannabis sativa]|uniref:glucose-1-phosphate adenylyltransferase n=1 Tax=Cannabis sativa TaxID=3483 RepID=A0A7J6GKR3_CANSA|nr:hypothetical protein G4B88_000163 [Cannabis sativa]